MKIPQYRKYNFRKLKVNYHKSSWLNLCYKLGQMEIAGEKKEMH